MAFDGAHAAWAFALVLCCSSAFAGRDISISSRSTIKPATEHVQLEDQNASPTPPKFPDVYVLKYEVSVPHLYLTQPQGLTFPVTVWFDGPNRRMRVEIMNGLDTTITTDETEYTIYPRINVTRCGVFTHGPVRHRAMLGANSAASNDDDDDLQSVLPDLTGWDFAGTVNYDAKTKANIWQYQHKDGDKVSQYTFYVAENGTPLKFLMMGVNYLTNGHFDEYNYEFKSFSTKPFDSKDNSFTPPAICKDKSGRSDVLHARHPVSLQLHALTPRIRGYDHHAAYHTFVRAFHGSHAEHAHEQEVGGGAGHMHAHTRYMARLRRFQSVVERVRSHNTDPSKGYKMEVNKWADWSNDEWLALMLPNKARKEAELLQGKKRPDSYKPLGKFRRALSDKQLPKAVDWRGTGADPGVKDQGMCGSCFAFSATGTMEGVWYVATGQHRSFSEQQILDCSWDYGPSGCGGGDYQPAFNYVAEAGGIALEQEYPYVSNNDYCKAANHSRPGRFAGYLEIESRDEKALMEAVYTLGPIAVAVDAEFESFRYYSEGVYYEPDCATASADLDHAVVLFGYGTTPEGTDYWLVRNSWAKFYGDDGYIKIRRGRSDCGISTDPAVAVVEADAVVPGMAERKRLEAVRAW